MHGDLRATCTALRATCTQVAPRTTSRPSSRPSDDKSPHGTAVRGRLAWRAEGNLHGAEGNLHGAEGNLHGVEGMWVGRDVGRARCGSTGGMSGGMWVGHAVGRARCGSGTMWVGRGKDSERPPRRETSRSPTRPLSRATAGGHVHVTVRRRASRRLHARHAACWSNPGFGGIPVRAAISAWLTASHPNSEVKQVRAGVVLRWGTTREGPVLLFLRASSLLSRRLAVFITSGGARTKVACAAVRRDRERARGLSAAVRCAWP